MVVVQAGHLGRLYVASLLSGRDEPLETSGVFGGNDFGRAVVSFVYRVEVRLVFVWRHVLLFFFFQFLVITRIQRQLGHIPQTAFALALYYVGHRFGGGIRSGMFENKTEKILCGVIWIFKAKI